MGYVKCEEMMICMTDQFFLNSGIGLTACNMLYVVSRHVISKGFFFFQTLNPEERITSIFQWQESLGLNGALKGCHPKAEEKERVI